MQCPSCRFENMPQFTTCVRCGSILPGAETDIGVQPPRAGKWEKRLRISRLMRSFNRAGEWVVRLTRIDAWTLFHERSTQDNLLALAWRAAIPGWPQRYLGMRLHARVFFFGWLLLLLLTLITYGLLISNILIGLVVSFHLSSIVGAVIFVTRNRSDRIALGFVMLLGAGLLFYTPSTLLLWRYFGLQRVTAAAGPIQNGDALMFIYTRDSFQPQAGQVILFIAPDVTYQAGGNGYGQVNNRLFGRMFDRVLAVGGQTVTWKDGQLIIDDQPSTWRPLVPLMGRPPNTTYTIPNGCCLVVPAVAFRLLTMPTKPEDWQRMTVVSNYSIYGRVWGIRHSLLHFVDLTQHAENATLPTP